MYFNLESPTENYLDLTPLYVTLALAFTFFIIYLLYALLSLDCFKSFARSCFVRCLAFARRKKRKLCKKLRESKYRVSIKKRKMLRFKHDLHINSILRKNIYIYKLNGLVF